MSPAMTADERRTAILKAIEGERIWWPASELQYAAFLEQGGAEIDDVLERLREHGEWEQGRGRSVSSFRATAEQLRAEGLLARRDMLSGMYARFQYTLTRRAAAQAASAQAEPAPAAQPALLG